MLLDIALGWDGRGFQALEPQLVEKDTHLRWTALDTRQFLNTLSSLGNRGGWMLTQVGLDRVMMGLQVAGGPTKLQAFERLNAPALLLLEVAAHRVFTHPHTRCRSGGVASPWPSRAALPSCVGPVDVDDESAGHPVP